MEVAAADADAIVEMYKKAGLPAAVIGKVSERSAACQTRLLGLSVQLLSIGCCVHKRACMHLPRWIVVSDEERHSMREQEKRGGLWAGETRVLVMQNIFQQLLKWDSGRYHVL
jgi:hypothetical protein